MFEKILLIYFNFQHRLSKSLLEKMVEAREVYLEDHVRPPFASMDDVESYSEKTFSSVYFLLLESLADNGEVNGHARHAANQVFQDFFLQISLKITIFHNYS